MIRTFTKALRNFGRKSEGTASIEILFMLPAFFILFLSAYEGGMVSTRHVMLERGLDLTVRDVRIGRLRDPEHGELKQSICTYAAIIPECMENLQLEMVRMDVRAWSTKLDGPIRCIDRALTVQPAVQFTNGNNNELMVLQVCALFDPVSSTSGWGRATLAGQIPKKSGTAYGLVASSAFVMEPFQ
mgnify:CR=1 FL=1